MVGHLAFSTEVGAQVECVHVLEIPDIASGKRDHADDPRVHAQRDEQRRKDEHENGGGRRNGDDQQADDAHAQDDRNDERSRAAHDAQEVGLQRNAEPPVDVQGPYYGGEIEDTPNIDHRRPVYAVLEILPIHDLGHQQHAHGGHGHFAGGNAVPRFRHPQEQRDDERPQGDPFLAAQRAEIPDLFGHVVLGEPDALARLVGPNDVQAHAGEHHETPRQRPEEPVQPRDAAVFRGEHTHQHVMGERTAHEHVPREHEPDIARPEEAAGPGLLALHIQLVADVQRDGRGKRGLCVNAWNERRNDRTRGDEAPDLPSEGRREQMQHAQGDALEEPRLARHRAEGERPHHDPPPGSGECGERSLKRNAFRGRPKDAHEQARNIFGHDLRYPPADGPYRDPEGLHGLRGQAVRRGDKGDPDTKRDEEKRKSLTNALYCIGRKNHRILLSQETVTARGEVLFRENRLHVDTTAICP